MKKLLVIGLVFVIALTVALAVVVAGCGSDDATTTTLATETTLGGTDTTVGTTDTTVEDAGDDTTTTVAQ